MESCLNKILHSTRLLIHSLPWRINIVFLYVILQFAQMNISFVLVFVMIPPWVPIGSFAGYSIHEVSFEPGAIFENKGSYSSLLILFKLTFVSAFVLYQH